MSDIETMLREIGCKRRTEGQMIIVRRELVRRQRRNERIRQGRHLLNAIGYLIVTVAVVIVLLSL